MKGESSSGYGCYFNNPPLCKIIFSFHVRSDCQGKECF